MYWFLVSRVKDLLGSEHVCVVVMTFCDQQLA